MYLRRCYRKKDGKRHAYRALVESYRTERGPRQRVVAWLGAMDEKGRLGVKRCAEGTAAHQASLFRDARPNMGGSRCEFREQGMSGFNKKIRRGERSFAGRAGIACRLAAAPLFS